MRSSRCCRGLDVAKRTYAFYKTLVPRFVDEARHFGTQPTLFLSLVSPKGHLEHYDACCASRTPRATSSRTWCGDRVRATDRRGGEDWSYMKFPYYKRWATRRIYRVGRSRASTTRHLRHAYADVALAEFRMLQEQGPVASTFHYHYARWWRSSTRSR